MKKERKGIPHENDLEWKDLLAAFLPAVLVGYVVFFLSHGEITHVDIGDILILIFMPMLAFWPFMVIRWIFEKLTEKLLSTSISRIIAVVLLVLLAEAAAVLLTFFVFLR